jgi:hypothetical protein
MIGCGNTMQRNPLSFCYLEGELTNIVTYPHNGTHYPHVQCYSSRSNCQVTVGEASSNMRLPLESVLLLILTPALINSCIYHQVPATHAVLASLANVLSALCLNSRGLDAFVPCKPPPLQGAALPRLPARHEEKAQLGPTC